MSIFIAALVCGEVIVLCEIGAELIQDNPFKDTYNPFNTYNLGYLSKGKRLSDRRNWPEVNGRTYIAL